MSCEICYCPNCDRQFDRQAAERAVIERNELLENLKLILSGFESGVFVRDISRDAESSWAIRLMPFIVALGKAQVAIEKAEAR